MTLCDRLEMQQQQGQRSRHKVRDATLQAISLAGAHELQSAWSRLANNFPQLFQSPEDGVDLKGLILDLAVSGRMLSSKERAPNTGKELLESIAIARLAWAQSAAEQEKREAVSMLNKLRTQRITLPQAQLPKHWTWASLLQVSQAVVDCHNKTATYVSRGI